MNTDKLQLNSQSLRKTIVALIVIISAVMSSQIIVEGSMKLLFITLFCAVSMVLYIRFVEAFILVMLIANNEFFYLVPREIFANRNFQDLLYPVIVFTGIFYLLRAKDNNKSDFRNLILSLGIIVIIGILNAYFNGQPLNYGIKAAKGFYLILFYFSFTAKKINIRRFFNITILTGIVLTVLNNIQYAFWGVDRIFYYETELERAGMLRFLAGDFFMIFSPLIAFGEYLRTNKIKYFIAFIYMAATIVVQVQTRSIIAGFLITIPMLLYLARKINFMRAAFAGIVILLVIVFSAPMLQKTFIGKLIEITKYEIIKKNGDIGVRLKGYNYYFREIMKSPVVGRGIWNDAYTNNNPEDMKFVDIHLSDLGLTGFLFHFGLIGLLWLLIALIKIYRTMFINIREVRKNIHYSFVGYFIFSVVTFPTLNCLLDRRTIIYFVLTIALLQQSYRSTQNECDDY